jgi:hypothetical protein
VQTPGTTSVIPEFWNHEICENHEKRRIRTKKDLTESTESNLHSIAQEDRRIDDRKMEDGLGARHASAHLSAITFCLNSFLFRGTPLNDVRPAFS